MLRGLKNSQFMKAMRIEIQMSTQGKMIKMMFDLQTFEFEKGMERSEDVIVLRDNTAHRRFA